MCTGGAAAAYNRQFPERKCLSGIMLPTGVIGLLLSSAFTVVAFFMEQAESDQAGRSLGPNKGR